MEVEVNENNVSLALRLLKRKLQREGIYKELKIHQRYEKPSEKRKRKRKEAARRARKLKREM